MFNNLEILRMLLINHKSWCRNKIFLLVFYVSILKIRILNCKLCILMNVIYKTSSLLV